MNIAPSCNNTSFGSAYINPKGAEKFYNTWGSKMTNKLIKTAEKAKQSKENHLILDENGTIKLKNAEYGEFTTCNPPRADVRGNMFFCDIRNNGGEINRLILDLPDEVSAKRIGESFEAGTLVPEGRLDLFDAMELESEYKKSMIDKLIKSSLQ